jgi:hypothetical protein
MDSEAGIGSVRNDVDYYRWNNNIILNAEVLIKS